MVPCFDLWSVSASPSMSNYHLDDTKHQIYYALFLQIPVIAAMVPFTTRHLVHLTELTRWQSYQRIEYLHAAEPALPVQKALWLETG